MGVFYKGWDGDTNETLQPVEDSAGVGDQCILDDTVVDPPSIDDETADAVKDDVTSREGVVGDDLFPKSRLGSLDENVLKKLGLLSSTVKTNYFRFFFQLILPMYDPERSGINGDGKLAYYSKLEEWSNLYACQIGLGGSYGHEFKNVTLKEILHHDGCIVRDAV